MGRCKIIVWGLEEGREELSIPCSEETDRSMWGKHILNQKTPV